MSFIPTIATTPPSSPFYPVLKEDPIIALTQNRGIALPEARKEWELILSAQAKEDSKTLIFCITNQPVHMDSPLILTALLDELTTSYKYSFRKLDFSGVTFSDEVWILFCQRFPFATGITSLTLSNLIPERIHNLSGFQNMDTLKLSGDRQDKNKLAAALGCLLSTLSLRQLDLTDRGFDDANIQTIFKGLNEKNLVKLNLSLNEITDAGALFLLSLLANDGYLSDLKTLNLSNNKIDTIWPFSLAFKKSAIKKIYLDGNLILDVHLQMFNRNFNDFNEIVSIETLLNGEIEYDWNEQSAKLLSTVVPYTVVQIPVVGLHTVNDTPGFRAFLTWLKNQKVDQILLQFDNLKFSKEALALLCEALNECPIRGISLNALLFSDKEIDFIADQEWISNITTLNLAQFKTHFYQQGVSALNHLLRRASLQRLSLLSCGLKDAHIPELFDGVNLEGIIELSLERNELSEFVLNKDVGQQAKKQKFETFSNLKQLYLIYNCFTSLKSMIDLSQYPKLTRIIAISNPIKEDNLPELFLELKKKPTQSRQERLAIELFSKKVEIDSFRFSLIDSQLQKANIQITPREFQIDEEHFEIYAIPQQIEELMFDIYQTKKVEGALLDRVNGCAFPWKNHVYREALLTQFKILSIEKDGNCFFSSICEILGTTKTPLEFRREVVSYMKEHADDFSPFFDETEPFEGYLEGMKEDGEWAGTHEMLAVSNMLKRPIVIYNAAHRLIAGNPVLLPSGDGTIYGELTEEPIYLFHSNSTHFDALLKF